MASSVLTFVIVGDEDHPIFEADLAAARGSDASVRDEQAGRHVAQLWHSGLAPNNRVPFKCPVPSVTLQAFFKLAEVGIQ